MGMEGGKMPCGVGFYALPEECIVNILSLTTPLDACRLSLVSSIFQLAVESNGVWGRFLPSDYHYIITRSSLTTPPDPCRLLLGSSIFRSTAESDGMWGRFLTSDYHSIISRSDGSSPLVTPLKKKQLYFRLCDTPLLIDVGNKSFSLDKWSGKKCYMIAARELTIISGDSPHYWSWSWKSLPQSRFAEVAELRDVCWLEIRGKIKQACCPQKQHTQLTLCASSQTPMDLTALL